MPETVHLYLKANGEKIDIEKAPEWETDDGFVFRSGAEGGDTSGKTEEEVWSYQVESARETDPGDTEQNDLDNGRLVCEVGVAIDTGSDDFLF